MPDGYIGTREAAEIASVTTGYLRRLLAQGRLEGMKIGRDWLIKREVIIKFTKTERKIGRPPIDKR